MRGNSRGNPSSNIIRRYNRITTMTVVYFYLSDDNLAVDGCKRRMRILLDVLNVPFFIAEIRDNFVFPSCCASHIRVFMQLKMRLEAFVHYLPFTYQVTSIALWFLYSFVLISFTECIMRTICPLF